MTQADKPVLNIRVADTIDGIATATDNEIYSNGTALIWAPEIHNIDGKLMIFFAAGNVWNHVQSHVMVLVKIETQHWHQFGLLL